MHNVLQTTRILDHIVLNVVIQGLQSDRYFLNLMRQAAALKIDILWSAFISIEYLQKLSGSVDSAVENLIDTRPINVFQDSQDQLITL